MFLTQIVLDGFKSYATRTVISGFDSEFNAITGLNGSGKSNILDSICFVFGITNLSHVRASNLQDLVYKQGQAGVTSANVTLFFDNSGASSVKPVGYEREDSISVQRIYWIGGKNQYRINGKVVQQQQVHNFFQSVQLNVNNPHFLIMQGRITKVINMKPRELLGMIEEAAGTKLYEMKKDAALKTIEKKQRKVDEINELLVQNIQPQLERLGQERAQYKQFREQKRQTEVLECKLACAEHVSASRRIKEFGKHELALLKELDALRKQKESCERELEQLVHGANQAASQRMKELKLEVSSAQQNATDASKALASLEAQRDTNAKEIASAGKQADAVRLKHAQVVRSLEQCRSELNSCRTELQKDTETVSRLEEDVRLSENARMTGIAAVTTSQEGEDDMTMAQVNAALGSLEREKADLEMHRARLTAELHALKKELGDKMQQAHLVAMKREVKQASGDEEKLRIALHQLDIDEAQLEQDNAKARSLHQEIERVDADISRIERSILPWLRIPFTQGQNALAMSLLTSGRVKGVLARLFSVVDPQFDVALEEVAKGKLRNVVVDTEETAKALLKPGVLARPLTIVPLNRIQFREIAPARVEEARAVTGESNIFRALDLIQFDEGERGLANAMKYAFGSVLVVPDLDTARKVAYHPQLRMRAVTLEGDVFEPEGVVTGGSSTKVPGRQSTLEVVRELHMLQKNSDNLRRTEQRHAQAREQAKGVLNEYHRLKEELGLASHRKELVEQRYAQSGVGQAEQRHAVILEKLSQPTMSSARLEEMECKLKQLGIRKQALHAAGEEHLSAQQEEARLQRQLDRSREAYEKAAGVLRECKMNMQRLERQEVSLATEKDELEQELNATDVSSSLQSHLNSLKESRAEIETMLEQHRKLVAQAEADIMRLTQELAEHQEGVQRQCKQVQATKDVLDGLHRTIEEKDDLGKRLRHRYQSDQATRAKLESEFGWLTDSSHMYVQAIGSGGPEDVLVEFSNSAALIAGKEKLEGMKEQVALMSTKMNARAMTAFERADQEYKELTRKKEIILGDREQIQSVIQQLDEKKKVALEAVWVKVNASFSSIFSTLLPGSMCKLEPPEGATYEQGLEIKVGFGATWKKSLSELSGGQRSLIALSLILALLRFKPAPMYILDEVDSALDLSHTQNIGRMIKAHFKNSQFLVVSLKEGMFNNANVLFRTKFVDGVSTVSVQRNLPSAKNRVDLSETQLQPDRKAPAMLTGADQEEGFGQNERRKRKLSGATKSYTFL
ncbi:Structural maintenance of chromosomes protein 2-1 [Porphyridium purpureum]|uniref:Structural maintenance of chromosomes protein n=1 Tax=Porphyridium purpureum TaxID=35688 RepID=A0A5J4YZE2_PORPP|nr:Structural maintenance of chromosomes protein 2-1 [Porphyridium purpureum]|eukprot:POR7670..scf208_2